MFYFGRGKVKADLEQAILLQLLATLQTTRPNLQVYISSTIQTV